MYMHNNLYGENLQIENTKITRQHILYTKGDNSAQGPGEKFSYKNFLLLPNTRCCHLSTVD